MLKHNHKKKSVVIIHLGKSRQASEIEHQTFLFNLKPKAKLNHRNTYSLKQA